MGLLFHGVGDGTQETHPLPIPRSQPRSPWDGGGQPPTPQNCPTSLERPQANQPTDKVLHPSAIPVSHQRLFAFLHVRPSLLYQSEKRAGGAVVRLGVVTLRITRNHGTSPICRCPRLSVVMMGLASISHIAFSAARRQARGSPLPARFPASLALAAVTRNGKRTLSSRCDVALRLIHGLNSWAWFLVAVGGSEGVRMSPRPRCQVSSKLLRHLICLGKW